MAQNIKIENDFDNKLAQKLPKSVSILRTSAAPTKAEITRETAPENDDDNFNSLNEDFEDTGKSMSEALIFESTNPQYDNRLFIELKFMFSKKATKIDEIFTIDLTLCTKCQIDGEDFVNFCGLLGKHELYIQLTNVSF